MLPLAAPALDGAVFSVVNVMSPVLALTLVGPVLSAASVPASTSMPPGAVMEEPAPIENVAAPGSRSVVTAPPSLIVAVKDPCSMIDTPPAKAIERPALSVRLPAPALPEASMVSFTLMSVLACSVRLAPFNAATTLAGSIVTSPAELSVKNWLPEMASDPPLAIVML